MPLMKNVPRTLASSDAIPDHPAVVSAALYRYGIRLSEPMIFNGKRLVERRGLVLRLEFADGKEGLAEASPLLGFSPESLSRCEAELQTALTAILNQQPHHQLCASAAFALDCALQQIPPVWPPKTEQFTVPLLQGDVESVTRQFNRLHKPPLVKLKSTLR